MIRAFAALGAVGAMSALFTGCDQQETGLRIAGDTISVPLTSSEPDPKKGLALFSSRGDAHCVLCHAHEASDAPFQGTMGPDLTGVHRRLSEAQIRLRIVDYDQVQPGTTMPSYYRTKGFHQVVTDKQGQTVLTGQEIEDIIAFLMASERT